MTGDAIHYLPKITVADFEAFRSILSGQIGATFQEWLKRRDQKIALYGPATIIEVAVDPDQFKRFCFEGSRAHDVRNLYEFAERTAKAKA
jgi:hypothetical protein